MDRLDASEITKRFTHKNLLIPCKGIHAATVLRKKDVWISRISEKHLS